MNEASGTVTVRLPTVLVQLLGGCRDQSAKDISDAVLDEAMNFKGQADQFDDFTLVVIKSL